MIWLSGCVHTAAEAVGFQALPAARRGVANEVEARLKGLGVDIDPVDEAVAVKMADAYSSWGKGAHPAGLNFGDCFAYTCARPSGAQLLFVGNDFAKTDVAVFALR